MTPLSECVTTSKATKIKVSEAGRKAVFLNSERKIFRVIQADDCLYKNMLTADWIVCGPSGDLIVELKGCDVGHAVKQISSTIVMWSKDETASKTIAGLIVCSRVPRFDGKIQRGKEALASQFRAKLHVCSRNKEHHFDDLF